MRLVLASAFVALLVLGGCRDYVVNPGDPGTFAPPNDGTREVTLKGPHMVVVGTDYEYKAEGFTDDARYDWRVSGPDGFGGRGTDSRYFSGRALATGEATVRVYVLAPDDALIGYAERTVEVVATL